MDYFFYGTLMDGGVLARVIGRRLPRARFKPARVEGFRRVYVRGAWYPMLVPEVGGRVEGLLVRGLRRKETARLARYEGTDFAETVLVVRPEGRRRVRARAFMARPGVVPADEEWHLDAWARRYRKAYLGRAAADRR